jgi:chromosome segregation ATPase|mmetsp:Transcript_2710/g.4917  ORF Transcript_2710/g.4917 Transcript_2710/m.4917 type:complete len:290 (-) Transcript_2710:340-1209(-)
MPMYFGSAPMNIAAMDVKSERDHAESKQMDSASSDDTDEEIQVKSILLVPKSPPSRAYKSTVKQKSVRISTTESSVLYPPKLTSGSMRSLLSTRSTLTDISDTPDYEEMSHEELVEKIETYRSKLSKEKKQMKQKEKNLVKLAKHLRMVQLKAETATLECDELKDRLLEEREQLMNIYVERLKEMKDDSAQTDSLYGKKAIVCETQTEDELIVDRPKWVLSSEQDYETQTSDEALANAARSNWSTPSLEKSVAPETQTRPRRSFFRGILVGVGVVSLTIGAIIVSGKKR